ncbi:hypothetical protein KAI87_05535 [Myxococcota bacterium]|nr:hypothetical protein [Myxococcota bacterium]
MQKRVFRLALTAFMLLTAYSSPVFAEDDVEGDIEEISAASESEVVESGADVTPAEAPAASGDALTKDMALIFALNNVFTSGAILSAYHGMGIGLEKSLSSDLSVRTGFDFRRTSNPSSVDKATTTTGGDTVTSYTFNTGGLDELDLEFDLMAIKKLSEGDISPYVGGGLRFGWYHDAFNYTDDLSQLDRVTTVDNSRNDLFINLEGVMGATWRVHENFSIFAEYGLSLSMLQWTGYSNSETIQDSTGGVATTSRTTNEGDKSELFQMNMGLYQGGSFGLLAHF